MEKEIPIGKIGKLILTSNIQEIINYLHMTVGAKEWSGILFYKLTKGNIKNLKDLEFTADFLYPMNIGSSTYTEFNYNGEVINAYDIYEDGMEASTGMVHTHHNMSTFFSNTDQNELKDNAKNFNYYISLIVNFDGNYCAKIALPTESETKTKVNCKDSEGKIFTKLFTQNEKQILIGELDIVKESNALAPQWLVDRQIELVKKNVRPTITTPFSYGSFKDKNTVSTPGTIYRGHFASPRDLYEADYNDFEMPVNKEFVPKAKLTGKEFLSALINLDASKRYRPIYQSINELKDIDEYEQEMLGAVIDTNIEIIYGNMTDDKDMIGFSEICIDAIEELNKYKLSLAKVPAFKIIKDTLEEYAALQY